MPALSTDSRPAGPRRAPRAFTLIELLVVVSIIVVLVAVLLPAMSGALSGSRSAVARSQMKNFLNGADSFSISTRRLPGRFPVQAMAAPTNGGGSNPVGFTAMENALLDLGGGIIGEDEFDASLPPAQDPLRPNQMNSIRTVGPFAEPPSTPRPTQNVLVDTLRIGAGDGAGYLKVSQDQLRPIEGQFGQFAGDAIAPDMPDLIDPWGNPYLLWVRDEGASGRPSFTDLADLDYFARREFDASQPRALFYWSTNAGYLQASKLGKALGDQAGMSAIGSTIADATEADIQRSLAGVLGSPASPVEKPAVTDPWRPSVPRGSMILISAGPDGVFFKQKGVAQDARLVGYYPTGAGSGTGPDISQNADAFDDLIEATGG